MAQIGQNVQQADTSTLNSFDALPAGDYAVVAVDSELKTTNAGNGDYFSFQFEVVEGDFKGRRLFHNMTRQNPNPKAVSIGEAQLKSLMDAVGKPTAGDTTDLHNIPLMVSVKVRKSEQYGEQNDIKKFAALSGAPTAQPATTGTTGQTPWGAK